jgi:hypothetical protein
MNKILLTVLIGAAVAGVVYYLYDKEGAEKMMGDIKDSATDAFGQVKDKFSKTSNDMAGSMNKA